LPFGVESSDRCRCFFCWELDKETWSGVSDRVTAAGELLLCTDSWLVTSFVAAEEIGVEVSPLACSPFAAAIVLSSFPSSAASSRAGRAPSRSLPFIALATLTNRSHSPISLLPSNFVLKSSILPFNLDISAKFLASLSIAAFCLSAAAAAKASISEEGSISTA
jgi:hypothetical protein